MVHWTGRGTATTGHGRVVAVTGASGGIGRAAVAALAAHGYRVWALARETPTVGHPRGVRTLRCDLTDEAQVDAAAAEVADAGPLHALVNCVGLVLPGPLEHLPPDSFRRQLDANLTAPYLIVRALLPALRRAEGGRIVMVGSVAGRIATPLLGAYHAAKFGLVGLTDTLRAELAPTGIRVVLIEPGTVATGIWQRGREAAQALQEDLPPAARTAYGEQFAALHRQAARAALRGAPPERVAAVVVEALTRRDPRPRHLVGGDARVAAWAARLPHRLRYRLTAARR